MKVFFAYPTNSQFAPWEGGFVPSLKEEMAADKDGEHEIADSPESADLVVLVESQTWKDHRQSQRLQAEPLLVAACHKVVTINYEDSPAGYLRGVYSSLESSKSDPAIHKSWPLMFLPNWDIYGVPIEDIENRRSKFIFSFAGAITHPFRRRLFEHFRGEREGYRVIETRPGGVYGESERRGFINDILNSDFVLCPRGAASYSHRIPEVMALGRIPVIIADGWIPFSIPESDYYIRIPEADVSRVADILQDLRKEAAARGEYAREVWLRYFSKGSRARSVANVLSQLVTAETPTLEKYRRRWKSRKFRTINRLTPSALFLKWIRPRLKNRWRALRRMVMKPLPVRAG